MASNNAPSDSTENISTASSSSSTPKMKDDFLDEILMCGICLSRMTSPCCLPCAHSFCRSCLLDYAQNNRISTPISFILCPYCKYRLNFRSFEHFESMLIINPVLKQLCEALSTSKLNSDQPPSGTYQARCHTCCLLKMLKVCKHCYFMLCEPCRQTHLLDVHRESKVQLDLLESRIHLVNKKRAEMDKQAQEYDDIRQCIDNYVQRLIHEIEHQRDQALQILDERQRADDEAFWMGNGFDNGEKFDFFISLVQTGQKKLLAQNITDRELMELFDNLQTMPNVNEKLIDLIKFSKLILELDESFSTKQFIRICDQKQPTEKTENLIHDQEQTDCVSS